jgi:phospholipid-transporting ATPase
LCILQEWNKTYYKASTALQYRERKLDDAANLIENNLILLGATAIEDRLQDQVLHTKTKELDDCSHGKLTSSSWEF